ECDGEHHGNGPGIAGTHGRLQPRARLPRPESLQAEDREPSVAYGIEALSQSCRLTGSPVTDCVSRGPSTRPRATLHRITHIPLSSPTAIELLRKPSLLDSREDAAGTNVSRPAGLNIPRRHHGEAEDGALGQTGRYTALGRNSVRSDTDAVQLPDDIVGCRLRDFTDKSCSFECEHSLAGAQSNIQASGGLVDVGPDTLLHQAQRGILVGALCGSGNDGRTTTATRTPPSPPQTTLRSSTRIPPAPTTSSATTTSTTSTTGTTSVSQPAGTSEPTTSSATSTAQPSSTSQDVTAAPPQPSTSDESTSSRTWSTTTAQPRQTLIPGSGGGTPFDFVAA
ncbi:hypothetical protein TOPH_04530, partial [Tolypocladium ophioglossoides CBS 100239]